MITAARIAAINPVNALRRLFIPLKPLMPHWNVNRPYGTNGLNQLTTAGVTALGYDGRGNLISSGSSTYSYTSSNQLNGTGSGIHIRRDPVGRLLLTYTSPTQQTYFDYDGTDLIAEYNANSALLRRYVHGPGSDEPLVWYEGSTLTDRRFLHADERGSVIAVSDGTGAVTTINKYDEYGIPAATNVGRFQYTGQAWLPELGMYYYKARIYSPTLGRFMQTDPIGYGDGMNWYDYVGGDPVNGRDPSGLLKLEKNTAMVEKYPGIRGGCRDNTILCLEQDKNQDNGNEIIVTAQIDKNSDNSSGGSVKVVMPTRFIEMTSVSYAHIFAWHVWFPFSNTSRFSEKFRSINAIYKLVGETIRSSIGQPRSGTVNYTAELGYPVGTDRSGFSTTTMTVVVKITGPGKGEVKTAFPGEPGP